MITKAQYDFLWQKILALEKRLGPGIIAASGGGGSGITALTGDVTATGPGSAAATIANDAVTNAKLANMAQDRIKGRADGAGTGDPQDLTPDQTSTILDTATDPFVRTSAFNIGSPFDFAPTDASYVTMGFNSTLSNERKLTAGSNITIVDGGANGDVTISAPGSGGGSGFGNIPTSGWTVRNSLLYNDYLTPDRMGVFIPDNASFNYRLLTRPIGSPADEYTVIATLTAGVSPTNSTTFGLYVSDGTKVLGIEMLNQNTGTGGIYRVRVISLATLTSTPTQLAGPTAGVTAWPTTLKIVQNTTSRKYYYFADGAFTQLYSETNGTFLTETEVGFGGISIVGNNGAAMFVDLLSWELTGP